MTEPLPEAVLERAIERAIELASLVRGLFGPPPATLTGADRVLWGTLRGLLRDELSMYEAIVAIAGTPGALAAEPLVRSILEGYANVLWVVKGIGDKRGNTPQVRALCFQLGAADQSVKDLDRMEKELGGPAKFAAVQKDAANFVRSKGGGQDALAQVSRAADARRLATDRYSRVQTRHAATGCACPGRNFNASWILALMVSTEQFLFPSWVELSPSAHFFRGAGVEGDIEAVGTSVLPFRSLFAWRAFLLGVSVHAFAESARLVSEVENPGDDRGLAGWASSFRALPAYQQAIAGVLDELAKTQGP